jgi:hypothetical protein
MNPLNIHCVKCNKSFDRGEQMTLYKDSYYHNTCFKCSFCDQGLAGKGFFAKPDGSFQCNECHKYHAPKCFICEQAIPDGVKYNIYQGKHFHRDCFKCVKWYYYLIFTSSLPSFIYFIHFSNGTIPEGKSFVDSPKGLQCLDCANITNQGYRGTIAAKKDSNFNQPQSSQAPHASGREHECAKCKRHIPPNTVFGIYENRQYHSECFTCNR